MVGRCENGTRHVPIKMLDVAGLVPGASKGEVCLCLRVGQAMGRGTVSFLTFHASKGLGNQFLDDLRTADMLIHIVDVSGTTDAAGKVTQGYDPINDIDWLRSEIHSWIYGNLMKRWGSIVRKHVAVKVNIAETLQTQLSGYGANLAVVQRTVDRSGIKEPLEKWDDGTVSTFVDAFLDERFPTVIALNKIDLPDADNNIDRICRKYDSSKIVLTSAASENFLRKLQKQGFVKYYEGTDRFDLKEDQAPDDPNPLKPLPPGILPKLEKLQDLVLFRYGTTGIQATLKLCVSTLGLIPTYPVRNINNFGDGPGGKAGVFRDCMLVRKGSKVRDVMEWVLGDNAKFCQYAETVGSIRLGEEDLITEDNCILAFKMAQSAESV
ncbi:hypothetical protein HDU96_009178 [Phlyctochytrium bullatum]|nr:hypothetical protein HDU96_009178 [Phlyctochytrium bullatum]